MATDPLGPAQNTGPIDPYAEYGSSGLKRYGGYVQEEFLRELQGPQGVAVFAEMAANHAICAAMLYAVETMCRRASWRMEAGSEQREDQEAADFIDSCRDDMSTTWQDVVSEALTALIYGWSYHEIVYKVRRGDVAETGRSKHSDGKIGWRKLPLRAQESLDQWVFDPAGGIQGMIQRAAPTYLPVTLPIDKCLLFRTTTRKNNPEGRSLLRGAYRSWYIAKNIETFEAIGIERDLAGIPYARIPGECMLSTAPTAKKEVYTAFKKILTSLRNDEQASVILPSDRDANGELLYDLGLMGAPGSKQIDTDKIIRRYDQRIAQTILADLILIGHSDTGSYALMAEKVSLFSQALDSILDVIEDVFNRYAIPRTLALNGYRLKVQPMLRHGPVEKVNLKDLSEFVSKISGAGIALDDEPMKAYLREAADLPAPPEPEAGELDSRSAADDSVMAALDQVMAALDEAE